jgi:hypothetical protein
LVDRLVGFKVKEFLSFAKLAGVPLGAFLSTHPEIDEKWTVEDVPERLQPLVEGGVFPGSRRGALEELHWDAWTRALVRLCESLYLILNFFGGFSCCPTALIERWSCQPHNNYRIDFSNRKLLPVAFSESTPVAGGY